jgi:hypothetical protein
MAASLMTVIKLQVAYKQGIIIIIIIIIIICTQCLIKHHAVQTYREVEIDFHAFLISALYRGE